MILCIITDTVEKKELDLPEIESVEEGEELLRNISLLEMHGLEGSTSDLVEELEERKDLYESDEVSFHHFDGNGVFLATAITSGILTFNNEAPVYSGWLADIATIGLHTAGILIGSYSMKLAYEQGRAYMRNKAIGRNEARLKELRNNLGELYAEPSFDEVRNLLGESESINYLRVEDFQGLEGHEKPDRAARDYELIIDLLEQNQNFWEEEEDLKLEGVQLGDLEKYEPEEIAELYDIPVEARIIINHEFEAVKEDFENQFTDKKERETQIHQVIRYRGVEDPKVGEMVVYRLEIYQGNEVYAEMEGIIDGDDFYEFLIDSEDEVSDLWF